MANDITIAKNSISVVVYSPEVNDNYQNNLFVITPAQSTANQGDGVKPPKVVDLLRITHTMVIRGEITGTASKTAIAVKQDLVNVWKGAGAAGGTVSLTYDANASSSGDTSATNTNPISGYLERVNFRDLAMDEPDDFVSAKENYQNIAKFEVNITFIEGTQV